MSALRRKRRLRRVWRCRATSRGYVPDRANTMKTYILRDPKTVEPQKSLRPLRVPLPTPLAAAVSAPGPVLYIGLDVQTTPSPFPSPPVGQHGGAPLGHYRRAHEQCSASSSNCTGGASRGHAEVLLRGGAARVSLVRFLRGLGYQCIIVCPSRVPRRPGDRVKTDRRDADQLGALLIAPANSSGIHVPEPEDEAMRDLLRSRDQVRRAQHRARQQLKMFLLRHNFVTRARSSWTPALALSGRGQNCPSRRSSSPCRS